MPSPTRRTLAAGPLLSRTSAINITIKSPSPNNGGNGRAATVCERPASTSNDPEIAQLRTQIEDLETKLALYRRREQLDRDYSRLVSTEERRTSLLPIIQAVCMEFKISPELFFSYGRPNSVAIPRHVARFLAKELFPRWSLKTLIAAFGHKNHTTLCHSFKACRNLIDTDPAFAARVERIRAQLSTLNAQPPNDH